MTDLATSPEAPSAAEQPPLVELRDIRVAFGGVHAVEASASTSTPVRSSAVVGGNGAGKSTLMHTLSGAHPADSGEILINGQPVTIHNPRDARQHGIEVIYQSSPWPTTSTPPGTCSSAASCARAPGRSTTRRWRRPRPR